MNCRVFCTMIALAASLAAPTAAPAVTIQPSEATSKDTFGYQFLAAMNFNSGGFGTSLPAGRTTTGHDTKSVLEFDLSTVGLTGSQVASATLELFVIDTTQTGFGASPSAGSPITVNLSPLAAAWDESTVSWATIPAQGSVETSLVISGINQTVSFDITALVKDWLDGALANNGLILEGDQPVGSSPNWVYAVFSSSAGSVAPALVITPVPEPASLSLALAATAVLGWNGWQRRGRRSGPR
jgi:hypothetical protein